MRAQFWGKAIIKLLCAISFSSFNCLTFVCPCYFLLFIFSFLFSCTAFIHERELDLEVNFFKKRFLFPNNLIALWDFFFFFSPLWFCFPSHQHFIFFKWRHSAWKSKMNKWCTVVGGEKLHDSFFVLCPQDTWRLA